ncbi:MAG: hypothetical protein ACR2FQ_01440 [Pseudonocardiaceae bacterium]
MRLLLLVLGLLLAGAAPASAHEGHTAPDVTSDVRSSIVAADLPPGVTLDVLQNGQALRLRNGSGSVVTVDGRRVAPGATIQWHSDAAHPSGDLGTQQPVRPWVVIVESDGASYGVVGELRWSAGPSPWPWFALTALLVPLAWWRPLPALLVAVGASVTHTAAALAARTAEGSRWALLGGYLPQVACWGLAVLAVAVLLRGRRDGPALGALAAAALVLLTAVDGAAALWSSTLVVAAPDWLTRTMVAVALGSAGGALVALARR